MPKTTPDVVEAAAKCFHFNALDLDPQYIVIYSPHLQVYALQSRRSFALHRAADPHSDWRVAIDLPPEGLMAIMGMIPTNKSSKLSPATSLPASKEPQSAGPVLDPPFGNPDAGSADPDLAPAGAIDNSNRLEFGDGTTPAKVSDIIPEGTADASRPQNL